MTTARGRAIVATLALALGASPSARAQDPYRQTVVVTATATPTELGSVTKTLTVITRDEIAALPVYSVADVLRLLSSVDVRARGERGVQTDFSVRGAGFGQMLVLVDGVRLNDVQSGHHNGDIPVPVDAVERIEILHGPGSSLFGADAFGGTVNVITRRDAGRSVSVHGGSFGGAGLEGQAGFTRNRVTQSFSGSLDRSSGFMDDRDFNTTILRSRTALGDASNVSVSFQRKEFGANNFYGGNAPSREWTNQALVSLDHRLGQAGAWTFATAGSYRTHGDRFVFNQLNPALSDNRHRTHTMIGAVTASRRIVTGTITGGVEAGGDWIRSSNLGDHELARGSGFVEVRQTLGGRVQLDGSLRVDRYSQFGTAWNPSVGAGWWATSALRLRGSVGRAFRVPTFTERYYRDPANLARADVGPEHAWAGEGGADLLLPGGWMFQATVFTRADTDVIDWLRENPTDIWQTYNVRDIDTEGVELGVRKTFSNRAFVLAQFTELRLSAPAVTQLSKYALDYAPRSFVASGLVPIGAGVRLAPRLEYRRRSRSAGTEDYVLLDARVSRRIAPLLDLHVDGMNLFDQEYQEVGGVAMPGASMLVGLTVGR